MEVQPDSRELYVWFNANRGDHIRIGVYALADLEAIGEEQVDSTQSNIFLNFSSSHL